MFITKMRHVTIALVSLLWSRNLKYKPLQTLQESLTPHRPRPQKSW